MGDQPSKHHPQSPEACMRHGCRILFLTHRWTLRHLPLVAGASSLSPSICHIYCLNPVQRPLWVTDASVGTPCFTPFSSGQPDPTFRGVAGLGSLGVFPPRTSPPHALCYITSSCCFHVRSSPSSSATANSPLKPLPYSSPLSAMSADGNHRLISHAALLAHRPLHTVRPNHIVSLGRTLCTRKKRTGPEKRMFVWDNNGEGLTRAPPPSSTKWPSRGAEKFKCFSFTIYNEKDWMPSGTDIYTATELAIRRTGLVCQELYQHGFTHYLFDPAIFRRDWDHLCSLTLFHLSPSCAASLSPSA